MNILILHNNNLPVGVLSESIWQIEEKVFNVDYYVLALPPTDRPDFDSFVSNELNELGESNGNTLSLTQYDLIVMPLNFTESYMEYTGLRVAAHIRLTKEWKSFSTPILFLGSDNRDDIMRFSPLGELLNTFNIYYSKHNSVGQLCKMFLWINQHKLLVDIDSSEYRSFLYRLRMIPAPANFATHHSIANEWAIMRWIDMITWNDKYPKPEIIHKEFTSMLYFKYLMAVDGEREAFSRNYKKNNPIQPRIEGIAKNRIVCIDDEGSKGWKVLLESIFKASEAEIVFFPFHESTKSVSKEKLIDNIKDFLSTDYHKHGGADCYIIDLRLHDDDFGEDVKYQELTGHTIADYIKSKELNPYNQVVIFTASNKVWNYEKAVKLTKACGYVIKESPEQNLSKTDSKDLFNKFSKDIKHACEMSFLRGLYSSLKKLEKDFGYAENELLLLYQFVELLNINNNQKQEAIIKAATLTLSAFLETFLKLRFTITSRELFHCKSSEAMIWQDRVYFCCEKNEDGYKIISDVRCFKEKNTEPHIGLESPKPDADISQIVIPLFIYYGFSESTIRKIVQLRNARNTMAHTGEGTFTINDLKEFFDDIIIPLLQKEGQSHR